MMRPKGPNLQGRTRQPKIKGPCDTLDDFMPDFIPITKKARQNRTFRSVF
jgi:hypothetical protein